MPLSSFVLVSAAGRGGCAGLLLRQQPPLPVRPAMRLLSRGWLLQVGGSVQTSPADVQLGGAACLCQAEGQIGAQLLGASQPKGHTLGQLSNPTELRHQAAVALWAESAHRHAEGPAACDPGVKLARTAAKTAVQPDSDAQVGAGAFGQG